MKIDEQEWQQVMAKVWERVCTNDKLKMVQAGHLIDIMRLTREEIEKVGNISKSQGIVVTQ